MEEQNFVVRSNIRAFIKDHNMSMASDVAEHLNTKIANIVEEAIERAKDNKRKTVFRCDI